MGIYAQQEHHGSGFNSLYTAMLRYTGAMTAEELVAHHLQQDISQPQFWQASLGIIEKSVAEFEELANAY